MWQRVTFIWIDLFCIWSKKCLRHEPNERYSTEELLNHKYISGELWNLLSATIFQTSEKIKIIFKWENDFATTNLESGKRKSPADNDRIQCLIKDDFFGLLFFFENFVAVNWCLNGLKLINWCFWKFKDFIFWRKIE